MPADLRLPNILIIGAGGHGRVVADAIRSSGKGTLVGFLDASPELRGRQIAGVPVLGSDAELGPLHSAGVFSHAVIGIGHLRGGDSVRSRIADKLGALAIPSAVVVHSSVLCAQDVVLGPGTVALAGVILNTGAEVGAHAILNSGSIVEHDCRVAELCHIAPGAVLCGGVRVGANSLVGAGAVVMPHLTLGARVTVGAGSVVTGALADDAQVRGNPARP